MESKVYDLIVKMVGDYNDYSRQATACFATIVSKDINKATEYLKRRKDLLTYRAEACCDYAGEIAKILGVKLSFTVDSFVLYDETWFYTRLFIIEQEDHHE